LGQYRRREGWLGKLRNAKVHAELYAKVAVMKFLAALALFFALVGCETNRPIPTQAQAENDRLSRQVASAREAEKLCVDEMEKEPDYKRTYDEIIYKRNDSPNKFDLMTNKNRLNEEQVEVLKRFVRISVKCREVSIAALSGTPYAAVQTKIFSAFDAMYLKLMKGEITIGEANERRAEAIMQAQAEWERASGDLGARLNQMHNNEVNDRNQRATAMLPYIMQQQQNQQMQQQLWYQQQMQAITNNRPVLVAPTTTNCTRLGDQVNCTTR